MNNQTFDLADKLAEARRLKHQIKYLSELNLFELSRATEDKLKNLTYLIGKVVISLSYTHEVHVDE